MSFVFSLYRRGVLRGSSLFYMNSSCIRLALEWSWATKSRKYVLYKWSKMTNKMGAKTAGSLENAINSSKNPTYSTPVYSIPRMRQPCAFQKIRLAYRFVWCDNEDG